MGIETERSSPRSRGEVAATQRSEVKVDGGKLSWTCPYFGSYPPSALRAPSPRKRGEDSISQTFIYASTSSRILTNSALRYFLSPGQKIRDASRA